MTTSLKVVPYPVAMYFSGVRMVLLRWDFNPSKTYSGTSLSTDVKVLLEILEVM